MMNAALANLVPVENTVCFDCDDKKPEGLFNFPFRPILPHEPTAA